jgi:hypothetical protein
MANKNVIWCDSETLSKDISGKIYIVTGANSGVGFETTQQLVKQGAHVVMACRRVEAGEEAAMAFKDLKGSSEIIKCDLADLESVRNFVKLFLSKHNRLDGLACNAGMVNMDNKPKYTKDGFEITMAASFFGHFLMKSIMTIAKPIFNALNFSDSSWESAQASLHCLLSDEALQYSGQYFSQHSVLYQDKECKKGGFPMKSPNPHARDMEAAQKLVNLSKELVGIS